MILLHVHSEAKRFDTRRALTSQAARLGEVRHLPPLEFGICILATEEPEEFVEQMLSRYLDPGDTLAITRMRPGTEDVLLPEDRHWVEARMY